MARKRRTREEIIEEARNRREAQKKEALDKGYVVEKPEELHCGLHLEAKIIGGRFYDQSFNSYFCQDCVREHLIKSAADLEESLRTRITPCGGRRTYEEWLQRDKKGLLDLDEGRLNLEEFFDFGNLERLGYECRDCGIVKGSPYKEECYRGTRDAFSGREGTTYNCGVCKREIGTCGPMSYW